MERTGLIDLKAIKVRNYDKFYLKRNPFPAIGIPEETPLITVDREDVLKRFQNVIMELLNTGTSIITIMVGEYGSGKSHLLKLFKKSVNAQLISEEKSTIAAYIKTPGDDFSDFFYGFVDDIGPHMLNQLSSRFISRTMKFERGLMRHVFDKNVAQSYLSGKLGLEELLEKSEFFDLVDELKTSKFSGLDFDLSQAFILLSNPKLSSTAWRWFLGEHLDRDEKDLLHIDALMDEKDPYRLFSDFVELLKIVGNENLVILVDELEKITLLTATKKDRYQDDLRRLIDDHPKNMCFYLAIAPRQWQDLTKEPTALVRRLRGNWHLLEDFKESETRELIERYLYSTRFEQYPGQKIKTSFPSCDPSLYPFSDTALDVISKESKGVVSDILMICRKALEHAVDSGFDFISPDHVKSAIGKKG